MTPSQNPGSNPSTRPQPPAQPVNYSQTSPQPAATRWNPTGVYGGVEEAPEVKPKLYYIPAVGALLLVISLLLPWFFIKFNSGFFSLNGLNMASATESVLESMSKLTTQIGASPAAGLTSSSGYGLIDGWILLVLAVLSLVVAAGGALRRKKVNAVVIFFLGVASLVIVGLDLINLNNKLNALNLYQTQNPLTGTMSGTQLGIGLGLAIVAAIFIVIGAALTFLLFYSGPGGAVVPIQENVKTKK